jgi:serine/threonine protein kinase
MSYFCDDCFIDWKFKIIDKYIALHRINYGSYASVWLSYDCDDKKYCVLKIHNREDYKNGKRESRVYDNLASLDCPYIMKQTRNFDYVTSPNDDGENIHHCCEMEIMACSLFKLLKSKRFENGLPFDFVLKVTKQLLKALEVMHQHGIIHADVKPENILLNGMSYDLNKIIQTIDIKSYKKPKKNNGKNKYKCLLKYFKTKLSYDSDSDSNSDNDDCDVINNNNCDVINNNNFDDDKPKDNIEDTTDSHIFYDDIENEEDCEVVTLVTESSNDSDDNDDDMEDDLSYEQCEELLQCDIKLSDMGGATFLNSTKRNKHIQTKHYRSPEILLDEPYNEKSDMWALGCTIFELLTGKVMFSPDDTTESIPRYHLFLITQTFGSLPMTMIESSPQKDLFFTVDRTQIKGCISLPNLHIKKRFNEIENNVSLPNDFKHLLLQLFQYDDILRISAKHMLSQLST